MCIVKDKQPQLSHISHNIKCVYVSKYILVRLAFGVFGVLFLIHIYVLTTNVNAALKLNKSFIIVYKH